MQTHRESISIQKAFVKKYKKQILTVAQQIAHRINAGNKILIAGNGGSAADAQHLAAEWTGRLLTERDPIPAIALTTDTSALTAIGNDYGFEQIFDRQLYALARPGDVFIAISTSGNSPNILQAVKTAAWEQCYTVGLTGGSGGQLAHMCDACFVVDQGQNSARIQECHEFLLHTLVDIIDRFFLPSSSVTVK